MKSPRDLYGVVTSSLYDRVLARAERQALRAWRSALLRQAHGRTLELGAGTGLNLEHYPAAVTELMLTEPDPYMAAQLRSRVRRLGSTAQVVEAPGENLPLADRSVDTVVSTLVLCTVSSPQATVQEICRVLKPGGAFLFIEHVRSQDARLARWQARLRGPWSWFACGCQCNRETLRTIEGSSLVVDTVRHDRLFGLTPLLRPVIVGAARRR